MELITRRLRLNPLGPALLESTYAYTADPQNTRYMVFYPVQSRDELLTFFTAGGCRMEKGTTLFLRIRHLAAESVYWGR